MADRDLLREARRFIDGVDAVLDDEQLDVHRVRTWLAEADERIRAVLGE